MYTVSLDYLLQLSQKTLLIQS